MTTYVFSETAIFAYITDNFTGCLLDGSLYWLNQIFKQTIVTQRQLMRLFAVKLILSYEQKCKVRSKFLKNESMFKNKLGHEFVYSKFQ